MTSPDSGDLTSKVTAWLNSGGAPVEMRVARILEARALNVLQSVYFMDADENVSREVDVIAMREVQLDDRRIAAHLVIECKYAPKPWVLFRGRPAWDEGRSNFDRITTEYGSQWLAQARFHPAIENARVFQQEPRAGYGLTTATFSETNVDAAERGKDLAYKALLSATKAARAWARDLGRRDGVTTLGVVFPVVVLRGKLFEATLEGDPIEAHEIKRGQVYWGNPAGERPVLIDVLTDSVVDEYAGQFRESAEALVAYGQDAAAAINTSGIY
jgi:hypothetical protein